MVNFSAVVTMNFVFATVVFAAPTSSFRGPATWTNEGLGACGVVSNDTDLVVAVSQEFFDAWP